ncbi:MAG TPA: hypothetical protein DCF63_04410, partial [Planctomycetaceae bacterium]|nr:hypothetical protein [Planctomycetaceae bacterium]
MCWHSRFWLSYCCKFALIGVFICGTVADENSGSADQAAPDPTSTKVNSHGQSLVESLIEQLGSPSFSTRRQAVTSLWQLGSLAEERVKQAQRSTDKQVAELARQVGILIKVSGQVADITSAREVAQLFLDAKNESLVELATRGYWPLARAFLEEHGAYTSKIQETFFQQGESRQLIQLLVHLAEMQGSVDLAWQVVSRVVPDGQAASRAAKL